MTALEVRPANERDLAPLNALYNHYVETSPATFDIRPSTLEQRRVWFRQFAGTGRHRLFVAWRGEAFVGYSCSHEFRAKDAYETSVETTVYVAAERAGEGIGRALYAALFDSLVGEDVHRAYAGITQPNDASEALHRRFGFEPIGTFEEVGRKEGRYWSVGWWQKRL
ncbi:MAG: GNAT family N-acetyltransferase [Myxococcales bacterium]|nr:GNAT family N-acetyltransferase [Myxococcales bacterium]